MRTICIPGNSVERADITRASPSAVHHGSCTSTMWSGNATMASVTLGSTGTIVSGIVAGACVVAALVGGDSLEPVTTDVDDTRSLVVEPDSSPPPHAAMASTPTRTTSHRDERMAGW